jgi:hypothetical protein
MHVLVLPSSTKSQLHEPLATTTTTTLKSYFTAATQKG